MSRVNYFDSDIVIDSIISQLSYKERYEAIENIILDNCDKVNIVSMVKYIFDKKLLEEFDRTELLEFLNIKE